MNQLVIKHAGIFSLIFGAMLGIAALLPFLIGYVLIILAFFSSVVVILYMKKNDKHLGIIDTREGSILGAIIGFLSCVGFFIAFCPMVCILKLILKDAYYSYAIPEAFSMGIWLLFMIIIMVGTVLAMTNAATGMGLAWALEYFEQKPENSDARLDIKIDD